MKCLLRHDWKPDHNGYFGSARTCTRCKRHEHKFEDRYKVPAKCWYRNGQVNVYLPKEKSVPRCICDMDWRCRETCSVLLCEWCQQMKPAPRDTLSPEYTVTVCACKYHQLRGELECAPPCPDFYTGHHPLAIP